VALAESCFNPEGLRGAKINLGDAGGASASSALFNESQSRIVISCAAEKADAVLEKLHSANLPHTRLGEVVSGTLSITSGKEQFSWQMTELHDDWFNAIRRAVESDTEPVRSL
jgi:phosphoribosylformylglycinamidine (FGAM) synthase-like enzyme